MKFFTLMDRNVDVVPLVEMLDDHPELWDANGFRKKGSGTPHGGMSDIWIRYNDVTPYATSGDYAGFNDAHVPIWYPAYEVLQGALDPLIFPLMARVSGEMLGGVLITRIPAGHGIAPHVDEGWHVSYYDKFYLSLRSAPGATFHCGDEVINPEPGDLYHFDNRLEHWVKNESNVDRMTLIVCIRTNGKRWSPCQ